MYTILATGDVPGAASYFNPLLQQTIIPATSGTRPSPSHHGMTVQETDTLQRRAWNGVKWLNTNGYRPFVVLYRVTSNQSIPNNTLTDVSWNSAGSNKYNMWSNLSPTLVTIPSGSDGLYMVQLSLRYASQAVAAGMRAARIDVGGTEQQGQYDNTNSIQNATNVRVQMNHPMIMTGGEQITARAFHTAGVALDLLTTYTRMVVWQIAEI